MFSGLLAALYKWSFCLETSNKNASTEHLGLTVLISSYTLQNTIQEYKIQKNNMQLSMNLYFTLHHQNNTILKEVRFFNNLCM